MHRYSWALVFSICWLATTPLSGQPVVEECSTPNLAIPAATDGIVFRSDALDVGASVEIGELNVALDLTTGFVGNTNDISVVSPEGSRVHLHASGGGAGADFDVTYSDVGRLNDGSNPNTPDGSPSIYDCGGCLFRTAESAGTPLSGFNGELTLGTWTLEIGTFQAGNLNEWCVQAYETAAVRDLSCSRKVDDVGVASIGWVNGADYDAVRVYVHGELAIEVAGPFAFGEAVSADVPAQPTPQVALLRVVGVVDDTDGAPADCDVGLPAAAAASASDFPDFALSPLEPLYVGLLDFESDVLIEDVIVRIDCAASFLPALSVAVTSSSATTVMLHQNVGSGSELDVDFWELGAPNGHRRFDCGCAMQPSGPGSLRDFSGGTVFDLDGDGTWAITIDANGSEGTVSAAEIDVFAARPTFPPAEPTCTAGAALGTVEVAWVNDADYDEIRVFIGGELVEVLEEDFVIGAPGFYTTPVQALPSSVKVGLVGVSGGAPSPRARCKTDVFLPPVSGLTCTSVSGTEFASLSWTNESAYDEIVVYVGGAMADTLPGSATAFDAGPYAIGTTQSFELEAVVFDPPAVARRTGCKVLILDTVDIEICDEDGSGGTTSALVVDEPLSVEETEALVDFTDSFIGSDRVVLTSPAGTELDLHSSGPDSGILQSYHVLHSDAGVEHGPPFDCVCAMQPQGGSMAAFDGERSDGTWTLAITNSSFDSAVLNDWCLRIDGCATLPPSDLLCDPFDDTVTLSWSNNASYDEITILQDGALIATLAGDADTFTVTELPPGRYGFAVGGFDFGEDCGGTTKPCRTGTGFTEVCAADDTPLPAGTDVLVPLGFEDSMNIADVEVTLDIDVTFTSNVRNIDIVSPFETEVRLHNGGGSLMEGFRVLFSDAGIVNGSPFDCDLCLMQPAEGELAAFAGEQAEGEWNLAVTTFEEATVNDYCIAVYEGCELPAPDDLSCSEGGGGIDLSWSNGAAYDSIAIERNGELLATGLDGDTTSFADGPLVAGFYAYRVFGVSTSDGCRSGSVRCQASKGILVTCVTPDLEIGSSPVTSTIESFDDLFLDDVRVFVDLTHGFVPELDMTVTSPSGAEVQLYDNDAPADGRTNAMLLTFADGGAPQPAASLVCDCLVAPSGPGSLADLTEGSSAGTWSLEILPSGGSGASGTLNEWCVQLFAGCEIERPVVESCAAQPDGLPPVDLTWTVPDEADSILVIRNGITIATLAGDATDYSDMDLAIGGPVTYQVAAESTLLGCLRGSRDCTVDVGLYEVCDAPALAIPDNDLSVFALLEWENAALEAAVGDVSVNEVQISIELSTAFAGSHDLTISSPELTSVKLLSGNENPLADADDVRVTFSDRGAPLTAGSNTCECLVAPTGPGIMADWAGEEPIGNWLLAAHSFEAGTLDAWCVGVFPTELPAIGPDAPEFKRGDVDGSGAVVALVDALRLLTWFFGSAAPPPCMDAADVDDSESISALLDALRLLNWSFGGTEPAPPAPGPSTCGPDPSGTSLDCETEAAACSP